MQIKHLTKLNTLSGKVSNSVIPWTVVGQASLSMEFSRQEYWEWVAIPFSKGLPDPRIEPGSPVLQADSLLSEAPGKPPNTCKKAQKEATST